MFNLNDLFVLLCETFSHIYYNLLDHQLSFVVMVTVVNTHQSPLLPIFYICLELLYFFVCIQPFSFFAVNGWHRH